MADIESIVPSVPLRPLNRGPDEDGRGRRKRNETGKKTPTTNDLTDDQGDHRDPPPKVDDYA